MHENLSLSFLTVLMPVLVTYFLTLLYSATKIKNAVAVNYQGIKIVTGS